MIFIFNTARGGLAPTRASLRRVALLVHRYVGLAMAVFLVVAGLTGSLLAFYNELDAALNPELFEVAPADPKATLLAPAQLQERIVAQLPPGKLHRELHFELPTDRAFSFWIELEPEKWREMFVDPYTGELKGSRDWGGGLFDGRPHIMPFIYRLHYTLALGDVGLWLFGIVALLWTLDCFVGAYLTFPARDARQGVRQSAWLLRWLPAWRVDTTKLFSFVFTWHRASGLWVWALLFVFAWSAVAFNLRDVYNPVMGTLVGMQKSVHESLPELPPPHPDPEISLTEAHVIGQRLMAQQAKLRGFEIQKEVSLSYEDHHGVYLYEVQSTLDISTRRPSTQVYFDGNTGQLVGFDAATGISWGNTLSSWLIYLHLAAVGGLTYQVLVSVLGVAVAALSVTGVWIWWRKRSKRAAPSKSRSRAAAIEAVVTAEPSPPALPGTSSAE